MALGMGRDAAAPSPKSGSASSGSEARSEFCAACFAVAAAAAAITPRRYSAACTSGFGVASASNRLSDQAMPSAMCCWNIGSFQVKSLWPKFV